MAKRRTPSPELSQLARTRLVAYARRNRPHASGDDADDKPTDKPDEKADDKPVAAGDAPAAAADAPGDAPAIEPPPPKGEPWPDATPAPMRPVAPAEAAEPRASTDTVLMPMGADLGAPPVVPDGDGPEDPTLMPGPRDLPPGAPEDRARPPGLVPPGDSRSLRRGSSFALVYRVQTAVITRVGTVGTRGVWRVVDYPTSAMASSSYAKEVSRFVADGFSDYRG